MSQGWFLLISLWFADGHLLAVPSHGLPSVPVRVLPASSKAYPIWLTQYGLTFP